MKWSKVTKAFMFAQQLAITGPLMFDYLAHSITYVTSFKQMPEYGLFGSNSQTD